jgi:Protein of unknown function (DUF1553)/Protein of unknown function (DUF1549)/Planctomycete cytochrome C
MGHRHAVIAAAWLASCFAAAGGGEVAGEEPPRFNRDIRPILSGHCYACHGPDSGTRQAELRLDTQEGGHEWAIVPGDAEGSEVIARISSDDPDLRMPPAESKKPPLSAEQIELLRKWIEAGAEYEAHWAYIAPERPPVPEVLMAAPVEDADSRVGETRLHDWPRNALDKFLLARMEAEGISPAAEADRATLIRRVYFDLVGLPPTLAEVDEFLKDGRPDAYEQLVNRLLASPRFGERMATWWFDLVRFATTVGFHGDQDHRITPYRDYVIKSFNDNLPFDQFTIEQLAGDLLPNPSMWQLVATGYNRVLQTSHEGGAQDGEYRAKYLSDRVRNLSETWMAASMGCAECHDHKFDPYTQADHFRLQAFFADVDHSGNYKGLGRDGVPTPRPPEMLAWTLPVYVEMRPLDAKIAELERSLVGRLDKKWESRRDELIELKRQRLKLEAQFEPTMITAAVEPAEIRILPRGNWMDRSGPVVEPQTPQFMRQVAYGSADRATRLDLAKWLVARDHPLTARVVVNRLWKMYYGIGLSKELIDLGTRGEAPPNQELLDWLAVEFMESGWDMKHVIRLMVTTRAYRQSSLPRPEVDAIDPDNRLVARQSRFRLEAEQIRDNALAVSGLLVHKLGGEIVKPYQPANYYSALNFPERDYEASGGKEQFRRGVYVHWQRQFLHPWLLAFDAPTREECTAERPISSTPTAALVLLNDPSFVEAARALAANVLTQGLENDEQRIRWAWRQVLGRDAATAEVEQLASLLEKHRTQFAANAAAAEALVSVGISPRPKTTDVAELAAWMSVGRVLLNLSETITRN